MSDAQLEIITGEVRSGTDLGIKLTRPLDDDTSSFRIELNNGRSLNDFLPKGIRFLLDKKNPAGFSPLKNAIDFNPELFNNPNYLSMFAHECGHSLVKNPKKTHLAYLQAGHDIVYGGRFRLLPLEERLKKIYSFMKLDLDNEIDATDHGKIVGDLLGVDPLVYDDMTSISLQNHFWFNIYSVQKIFDLTCTDLKDETLVEYYDPFSQESVQITYGEFKTISLKSKDENAKTMKEIRKRVTI
jgi:hypothetical protein